MPMALLAHSEDKEGEPHYLRKMEILQLDLNNHGTRPAPPGIFKKKALYLSALDVTYERFRLGPMPFAKFRGEVDWKGKDNPSDLEVKSSAGLQGLANSGANWTASSPTA